MRASVEEAINRQVKAQMLLNRAAYVDKKGAVSVDKMYTFVTEKVGISPKKKDYTKQIIKHITEQIFLY